MTALADVLRWFRGRNDPPAMLPDPVTRRDIVATSMTFDRRAWAAYKRRLAQDGWTYISHRNTPFGNVESETATGPATMLPLTWI
mgnify:CR=1 FL=1